MNSSKLLVNTTLVCALTFLLGNLQMANALCAYPSECVRTAAQTGKTVEQVMADGDRDRWFTAQEALEYGFIDHIQKYAAGATGVGTK